MVKEFKRMRDEGVNVEKMLKVGRCKTGSCNIYNDSEHIDMLEKQTDSSLQ